MKKLLPLCFMLAALGCNNQPAEKETESTSTSTQTHTTEIIHDTVTKTVPDTANGTNIEINDNGVSYSNKDGNDASSVKISSDSTSVKIKKDN